MMKRREFITLLGGAAITWSLPLSAQAPSGLWKIGVLANEPWPPLEGLRHGLRYLGYVEGKSHRFEYRFALGRAERFPALGSELVNLPVDLIVAWGTPASLAAHKATSTIPSVMSAGDPIGAGIVSGLARPGGNVPGISVQMAGWNCSTSCCQVFRGSRCFRTRVTLTAASPCGRHGSGIDTFATSQERDRRPPSSNADIEQTSPNDLV